MKTTSARTAYCKQSTFAPSADRSPLPIMHSAICTLHSQNSFISRFFTVFTFVSPSIHDFHAKKISARIATSFNAKASLPISPTRPACGITKSLLPKLSTFPSQVPAIILFNLFYPSPLAPLHSQHSTSFHRKSPVIPLIPLNSTYAVPPKQKLTFPSQVPDFFAFLRQPSNLLLRRESFAFGVRAGRIPLSFVPLLF